MKTFRVVASYVTYCTVDIEAETKDEAWQMAKAMDGGDFDVDHGDGYGDWNIDEIQDITEEISR